MFLQYTRQTPSTPVKIVHVSRVDSLVAMSLVMKFLMLRIG